jgi:hypothetical protein
MPLPPGPEFHFPPYRAFEQLAVADFPLPDDVLGVYLMGSSSVDLPTAQQSDLDAEPSESGAGN